MDYLASPTEEHRELLRIYYQYKAKVKGVDMPLPLGFAKVQR
jgi:hypothetical protein